MDSELKFMYVTVLALCAFFAIAVTVRVVAKVQIATVKAEAWVEVAREIGGAISSLGG